MMAGALDVIAFVVLLAVYVALLALATFAREIRAVIGR